MYSENDLGQLDTGSNLPTSAGEKKNTMGDNLAFVNLGTNLNATKIASGGDTTCALTSKGKIKCWGCARVLSRARAQSNMQPGFQSENLDGETGLGTTQGIIGIYASDVGDSLPFVNLTSGTNQNATAVTCGFAHCCALMTKGKVKCWGCVFPVNVLLTWRMNAKQKGQ